MVSVFTKAVFVYLSTVIFVIHFNLLVKSLTTLINGTMWRCELQSPTWRVHWTVAAVNVES